MEIYLDRRGVRQIRNAARDAMEDGDTEALPELIVDAFNDDDVRSIERKLDGTEFYDFVYAMLDDWGGDDLDELFDLLESSLAEIDIDLTTEYSGDVDDTEVLEDEDEFPDTSDYEADEEPEEEEP